ncbi:MAG: ABC transporter permease subunit [Eubacteriales bacterium]|nr:ABC transporter permease subunit [Eubacteriales bacterium]
MTNLLTAGLFRLRKDGLFRLMALAVVLATGLITAQSIGAYQGDLARGVPVNDMEEYFFNQAPMMGMLAAVFVSLYWGAEYSDGAIRNKLCVGCRRSHVYLAHFTVCLAANLAFLMLWFLFASPMYFYIGPMAIGWTGFLTYAATCICFTAAFTALFTLICAAVTNKAYSVVAALGVWILLVMASGGLYGRLCEPEMNVAYQMLVGEEFVTVEAGPNPLYIGGTLRTVLEGVVELLPTGQAFLVNDINIWHPVRGILLTLAFTAAMLGIGLGMFGKKDIR